jgi:hypothetical protein
VNHRGRRAGSDFQVLQPLAELQVHEPRLERASQSSWTVTVLDDRRPRPGASGVEPPAEDPPPAWTPATVWRELQRRLGGIGGTAVEWLDWRCSPRTGVFGGSGGSSLTQGWPHRGSTVVRLVWAPVDVVARVLAGGARWSGLRLTADTLAPLRHEAGWSATGRLALPPPTVPVRVQLQVVPAARDRTWAHLVLASRARYPRRYWAHGHEALAALDRSARRLVDRSPVSR